MITPTSLNPTTLNTAIGIFFDGQSSRDHPAKINFYASSLVLEVPDLNLIKTWKATEVKIDLAISGVPRVIKFKDGSRFESKDDTQIRRWEQQVGQNKLLSGVRILESRWPYVLGVVLAAGLSLWGFIQFGLPTIARQAAKATPQKVLTVFDQETIKLLESQEFISESTLSASRQAQLQQEFKKVAMWAGGPYPYHLLLRYGNKLDANAVALPNGTIIMTDQLVKLAKNDNELMGVLAHETGHVVYRHSLKQIYQALGVGLVTTWFTGDLVSATSFAAAVPATLLQTGYSRAAETEADTYSGKYMMQTYKTTKPLQTILGNLEKQHRAKQDTNGNAATPSRAEQSMDDLISTHPGTKQRIAHLKQIEASTKASP